MGKGSQILKFVLYMILGFLPSFLFVTLLLPHGSPFENYINFLKDYRVSWWAWICAIGIMIVSYLFFGFIKYMKNPQNKAGKKAALITLFLLILIIFGLILTQAYFYGKFLMGSDLLIKLSSDKDSLFFTEIETQELNFKISASMNLFCSAGCQYSFVDLGSNNIIDSGNFNITSIFSKTKTYAMNKTKANEAQILGLFSVKCRAEKTRFCFTKAEEVDRSALVTLNYISDEEQQASNWSAVCCFNGACTKCCHDNNCADKNYPVIFLHGHSVNKALAADYSLDALIKIKNKLTKEGYIDAGTMVTNYEREQPGLWGKVNAPIAVTASYFFDVYKTKEGEEITVPSKTESIVTYAIRLRDIIDTVRYRTGKDKVIIIAHSMGGLVAQRYVQVFGDSDIEKAIFITIPNHGIDGKVRDYCAVLGEKSTCEDMNKDSIFINKLDNSPPPAFPIENIIGIGCNMSSETGDGIVKNSSQFLGFAKNYYVEGTCDELGLVFLHEEILDIDKYPKVYEIINKTIRS